jgi:hypothetical protein
VAKVVECLPRKCKILSSNPSTEKKEVGIEDAAQWYNVSLAWSRRGFDSQTQKEF